MQTSELLHLLDDPSALDEKVKEALEVLNEHLDDDDDGAAGKEANAEEHQEAVKKDEANGHQ
jgi:hypothetical protein